MQRFCLGIVSDKDLSNEESIEAIKRKVLDNALAHFLSPLNQIPNINHDY